MATQYKYMMFIDTTYNYNTSPNVLYSQSSAPKTGAVRFQSMIYKNIDTMSLENASDRWFMVKRHPLFNRAIIQASKMCINSHIEFVADAEANDEDKELHDKFVKEFGAVNTFQNFKINCETQGWSIIAKFFDPVFKKEVHAAITEPKIQRELDDDGVLKGFVMRFTGQHEDIHFKLDEVIFKALDDWEHDKKGTSKLVAAWDDGVWWVLVMFAMAEYDQRLGNGIHVVKVPMDLGAAEEEKFKAQYENLTGRRYIFNYIENDPNGNYGTEIVPPQQIDYPAHLDKLLESVASSFGLPDQFFIGKGTGTLSTATENGLQLKDKLEADFDEYVPEIREFMEKFMNVPTESQPAIINPRIELRMSDLVKAQMDLAKAQSSQVKMAWNTIDEIRADWGDEPLGEELPGAQAMVQKMGELMPDKEEGDGDDKTNKKQEEGKPPKPSVDTAPVFVDAVFSTSIQVQEREDYWVLDGLLSKEGFYDYSDLGHGTIYRSVDAIQSAVDLNAGLPLAIGIEQEGKTMHGDGGHIGEEIYAKDRVGVTTKLYKKGNTLRVKAHVFKDDVKRWFFEREQDDWVTPQLANNKSVNVSAGIVGSLSNKQQDRMEVRSLVLTRSPRLKGAILHLETGS